MLRVGLTGGLGSGKSTVAQMLRELGNKTDATIEFVPAGICPIEQFDLARTLRQACEEADYVRSLLSD